MRHDEIVLDASIAVKWFHEEDDTLQAEQLEERIARGEIRAVVPPLFFYEVANALTLKAGFDIQDVVEALRVLDALPLQVVDIPQTLLEDAVLIAREYHLSVYDAIYVALAIATDAPLVTTDRKLAAQMSVPIVTLLGDVAS